MTSLNASKGARVPAPTRKLVIRKANSQRDLRPLTDRLTLSKVLGLTCASNAALTCNPVNGIIAYPAGCTVVLFNPRGSKQEFIQNVCKKTISALTFSKDGKYLATGESGHMPSVRVWSIEDDTHPQISEMAKGHKHGVACLAFSPNLKYLVSVGYLHDMLINVWNWRDGSTVACNKFSTKVYAISFSELGDFFVTSGVRHVKFWYIDADSAKSKHDVTLPIKGRAGLLGELRSHTFCDVVCGVGNNSNYTYCVTTAGALCCFNAKRKLEKFVEIGSSKALCMVADDKFLICGYNNGFIRIFDSGSLEFITTLPKPHYLGVNIADGIHPSHMVAKTDSVTYGDTVAIALDSSHHRLTCVYSDHSLYVWDITDVKKVGKIRSSLYHSACVWGLEVYPDIPPEASSESPMPPGTFFTASNDDTVRVWNIEEGLDISTVKNIYSKELLRILYVDPAYSNLKDTEMNPTSKNVRDVGPESKGGVRCIRASPDGLLLAVGERSGNVRVYEFMFFDEILNIDAHESEVLCLEFSPPESGHKLLASAGRDRLLHVFDVNKNFTLIQTLDDHSASITSIKFSVDEGGSLLLLSCSADKSVIFRSAQNNPDLQFVRNTNYVGKTTLYDMVVDLSRGVAAVACQDRNIRVYDSLTGKQTKCYKGSQSDDGTLVKITMDNSGYFAATSSSDKSLSLYEFESGECMATMYGHSEIVTGMRFTNDLKKLITVSGDGCVFIWTIPTTYQQYMTERLLELGQDLPQDLETPLRRGTYQVDGGNTVTTQDTNGIDSPSKDFLTEKLEVNPPVADYRFSIGQLPSWAKKQIIAERDGPASPHSESQNGDQLSEVHSSESSSHQSIGTENNSTEQHISTEQTSQPAGRWGQRAGNVELHVVTEKSPQRPVSLPLDLSSPERKRFSTGAWQEQVDVLSKSPLERKCSLTSGEDDDLFPVNSKSSLETLKEDEIHTKSKSPEPRSRKFSTENLVLIETEEIKFEEALEAKDDDIKESIIYFPQSQDDLETETVSPFPGVKEMTRRFESLTNGNRHWHRVQLIHNTTQQFRSTLPPSNYNTYPLDFRPVNIEKSDRSFQVTAADKPERRSVGDDEIKEDIGNKITADESSSDEEEDPLSVLEDVKPEDETKTKLNQEEEQQQEEVKKYFECLASTPTKEKPPEFPRAPTPEDSKLDKPLPFLPGRLSISARFLSRSLLTTTRQHGMDTEDLRATSLEEHKLEIQRRREEMTRAVDVNRRRLTALRKAKEERELKNSGVSTVSITLKPSPPRRISLDMNGPADVTTLDSAPFVKQHRSVSSPFPVPFEELMTIQPERLKPESDTVKSGRVNNSSHLTPVVTNLFQNKLSSLHEQLIPEKDENVWVKRGKDDDKQTKANPGKENIDSYHRPVNGINASNISEQDGDYTTPGNEAGNNENERTLQNEKLAKELQANKESEKDESTLISKQEQKLKTSKEEEEERQTEKVKEPGDEDREKQKQIENAREEEERRKEIKQEEQKKREQEEQEILQQQLDIEKEKERQKQLEKQKQLEIEKKKEQEKQRRLEKAKEEREKTQKIEKEKEREREKLQQLENQKQHKLEIEKEKEREKEKQRKLEKSREEREKSREMEREKQQLEKERKQELELQKENQRDKQRELEKAKDEERLKQDQREIEKTKETEKEKERLKQKDLPKEREKLDKKDDSKDKKDKPKMEKRGSSSSLMAQTKSSWRKSLGFSGFKSKEKKEDKREPFANTLRTSDFPKKSEKVLFRDKRGKVSAEERRSKSKSLGDLEARLKPLREEIHLDQSSTRGLSTEDIPTDSQAGASLPPPFTDRRSPVGKDGEGKNVSKFQIYQDAVNQLNQAIKSITDLHAQVLEEDNSDDKEEMLALLTNTFTDTEEHCKQLRMRSTEVFKPRNRSMASNFSFSMNNLDTLATSSQPAMHRRASEASVPTAVEQEDASRDLLMRYSDILVEMVKQKLST